MQLLLCVLLILVFVWLIWEIWQKQSLAYLISKKGIQISSEEISECLKAVLIKFFKK